MSSDPSQAGRDRVAIVLAIAVGLSILAITVAALWDALRSPSPGLSENATQILTSAYSGIIGALAVYLGSRLSRGDEHPPPPPPDQPTSSGQDPK